MLQINRTGSCPVDILKISHKKESSPVDIRSSSYTESTVFCGS